MTQNTLRMLRDRVRDSIPAKLWFLLRSLNPSHWHPGNRLFDLRYGVKTSGLKMTTDAVTGLPGIEYRPTPVKLLRQLVQLPQKYKFDCRQYTFIDMGCGKGAVLLIAAQYPYRRIIGVEYSPEIYGIAQENVRCFQKAVGKKLQPIEVVQGEASQYQFPLEPTVLYMFNPFGAEVMSRLVENLQQSLDANPRPLLILYHLPWESPIVETLRGIRIVERCDVEPYYNFYAVNA